MSQANSVRVRYDALRSLDWTLITANYVGVGPAFVYPIRIMKITNSTDAVLLISFDGLDDKDITPGNTYTIYDYGSNRADTGGLLEVSAGDRFYVKAEGALPSLGKVYVTIIYASSY